MDSGSEFRVQFKMRESFSLPTYVHSVKLMFQ